MTITDTELVHLPLDQLDVHPGNLRTDLGNLDDLIASVQSLGIIEPLVVTPAGATFVVLAGHRRLAAAERAGLALVPCVVRRDVGDTQATEIMLVENLQRANLNPIEEGTGFARLAELGLSQREIAERVGCNQSHVSKRIKLTTLPEIAKALVVRGELEIADALSLARLVELDAKSADEWCADVRKSGVKRAWPHIAERIRRASPQPLPAVDPILPPSKPAPKPKAKPEPQPEAESPGLAATVEATAQADELASVLAGRDADADVFWDAVIERFGNLAYGQDIEPDVDVVLTAEHEVTLRSAEELRAYLLYGELPEEVDELAEEEARELHGEVYEPGGYDEDQAAELVEEIKEAHAEPASMEEDEQAALPGLDVAAELADALRDASHNNVSVSETETQPTVEELLEADVTGGGVVMSEEFHNPNTIDPAEYDEWDQQRTTPPWKAYAFTNETKTIGGIREHKNPAKLRWAEVYETANRNRPLVLAAITERLVELDGS